MKRFTLEKQINKLQKQLDNLIMEDEEKAEKLFKQIERLRKELFFLSVNKKV